jgi:hypothetical protein
MIARRPRARRLSHADRLARWQAQPNIAMLWECGAAGWHPTTAGLANESDARLIRQAFELHAVRRYGRKGWT